MPGNKDNVAEAKRILGSNAQGDGSDNESSDKCPYGTLSGLYKNICL